jgi:cytochrome P450
LTVFARLGARRRQPPFVDVRADELYTNPYPIYRSLRNDYPVAFAPALNDCLLVSRWHDVEAVLKDDDTFSAEVEPPAMPETLRGSLLFTDGLEHARMRASMQPPCQPGPARELAGSFVIGAADDLIDGFASAGEAELVTSFFEPLALQTLSKLTGVVFPIERLREWENHAAHYFKLEKPPPEAEATNRAIDAAILEEMKRVSGERQSSLVSNMVHWHDDAGGLTEQQLLASLKVFLAAGINEFRDLMSHTLVGLLSRHEQLAELRSDPSLAAAAVEEGARWASPVGLVPRRATTRTELGGVRVPAGALVAALVASANRDERRWTEPNLFDLHRDDGMHLGFASGVHYCLGAWLARAGTAVALERIVERLPGLRLGPDRPLAVTGWRFREVRRLQAEWEVG